MSKSLLLFVLCVCLGVPAAQASDFGVPLEMKDTVLDQIRQKLPENWKMFVFSKNLLFERDGEVQIAMVNQINAPMSPPNAKDHEGSRFLKTAKTRVIFSTQPRISQEKIAEIEKRNDALYDKIDALPDKMGLQNLINKNPNSKGGMFKNPETPVEKRKLEAYEKEREALSKRVERLPDLQSEKFSFSFRSMEGADSEYALVQPRSASTEAYSVLNLVKEIAGR